VDRFFLRFFTGIRFADYVFAEPVPFGVGAIPPQTGLFAVLVPDPTWGPRQFQPILFGVLNSQSRCQLSADEYHSCLRVAAGKALYIATYGLPLPTDSSETHRIHRELVHVYSPLCNRASADAYSDVLARKLEAMEQKSQEHELLIKVLLAAIGHMAQPPQDTKKRAVGFQPPSTSTRHGHPHHQGFAP
jgi:hypothetical protein